tara:strand:- start:537 stop:890 length:354 start_codon:yes stop_codon:yes gene_type:complete
MHFQDTSGDTIAIPTLIEATRLLRRNLWVKRQYPIVRAYLAGSTSRGEARPDSDLDILLVINPVKGKRSISVSEHYHARFTADHQKPHFGGRQVDFQFYYPDEESRILKMNNPILLT